MAFTVQDLHDLVALVTQHPEWRAELRRLVLTEELLELPQIVRDLAEAQQRTEQQVTQLTQQVAQVVEGLRRTERQIVWLQEDVGGAQRHGPRTALPHPCLCVFVPLGASHPRPHGR